MKAQIVCGLIFIAAVLWSIHHIYSYLGLV